MWFTERGSTATAGAIERLNPSTGGITEFPVAAGGHPLVVTAGPDGTLWFTEMPGNRVGRIDPATGAITEFPVPTPRSAPWEITAGPDGNIGRITPDGIITEFAVPTPVSRPNTIRPGPHHALYFVEEVGKIARITDDGSIKGIRRAHPVQSSRRGRCGPAGRRSVVHRVRRQHHRPTHRRLPAGRRHPEHLQPALTPRCRGERPG